MAGRAASVYEGAVFYTLSKLLDLAFSPLFWALSLAALAWGLGAGLPARLARPRVARILGASALATLYLPSTGLCAWLLLGYVERFDGPLAQADVRYDAVVLLGGFAGRGPDAAVEISDAGDRLLRAWEVLRDERAARVVIAAGGAEEGETEADVAADLLGQLGIARGRMLLDRTSRNTRENALQLRDIVAREQLGRLLLVTSAFHMQRALGCLRAVGLRADALATDHQNPAQLGVFDALAPRANNLGKSELALRELAGRAIYRLRGYAR